MRRRDRKAARRAAQLKQKQERIFPMGPFEMVIGIVLIVTIGSIVRANHGIRRDRHGHDYVAGHDAETKALQAEIRALKARIQVPERIQIRRGSVTERVCTYVEITAAAT